MLGIECSFEQPAIEVTRQNFVNYLSEYGISYGTKDEFNYRFQNYLKADKAINEINNDPELTFVSEHNQFSVLSPSEMK